jgi:hypothetical protein
MSGADPTIIVGIRVVVKRNVSFVQARIKSCYPSIGETAMARATTFIILSVILGNVCVGQLQSFSYHAVLVGVERYQGASSDDWTLNADHGAEKLGYLLRTKLGWYDITVLTNEHATGERV